jgi:hypothetical protein
LLENMRVNRSLTDVFSAPGLTEPSVVEPVTEPFVGVPFEVGAGDFLAPSDDLIEDGLELAAECVFGFSTAAVIFED